MKRRDFLFKAAEAAALALFGSMGLAEVVKKVKEQLAERKVMNRLTETTAQEISSLLSKADYKPMQYYYPAYRCAPSQGVSCNPQLIVCGSDARFYCGGGGQHFDCVERTFDCQRSFTCYHFRCSRVKFSCVDPVNFQCQPPQNYTWV